MGMKERQAANIIAAKEGLTQLQRYKFNGDYHQAQLVGIKSLRLLGVSVKMKPNLVGLLMDINRTKGMFNQRRIKTLGEKGKPLSDTELLQLRLLVELCGPTAVLNEDLYLSLLLQIAKIAVRRQQNMYSALGYAGFALIALRYLEEDDKAEILGDKALESLQVYESPLVRSAVFYILGHCVGINFSSSEVWQKRLLQGVGDAYKVGDTCYIGLNYEAWASLNFDRGQSLEKLHDRLEGILKLDQRRVALKMRQSIAMIDQATEALLSGEQLSLTYDQTYFETDTSYRLNYASVASTLAVVEEDYQKALTIIQDVKKDMVDLKSSYTAGRLYFNEGVAMTMEVLNHRIKKSVIAVKLKQLKRLFDYKVRQNPDQYGHLYKIISGCGHLLDGAYDAGFTDFEQAIALSIEKEDFRDAGIASILLGHHCMFNQMDKSALYYYTLGAEYYGLWGASSISEMLLRRYQMIIDVDDLSKRWQNEEDLVEEKVHLEALNLLEEVSHRRDADGLEVSFGQLLSERWQTDKTMIFSELNGQIGLVYKGIEMEPWRAIEDGSVYSVGLVQRVWNHKITVRINSDSHHDLLKYDAYLMDHGQGSLLGIPMVYDDHCYGVVYMERDADFDDEDYKTIELFTNQVVFMMKR